MRHLNVLLLLSLACARSQSPADSPRDAERAPQRDSVVLADGLSRWYERSRILDATGDGLPDTLRLTARGTRTDSLRVTLVVRSREGESLLASWLSDYDLIDPPDEVRTPGPARDSTLRAWYDRVLDEAAVEPFADTTLGKPWVPKPPFWDCQDNVHNCLMIQMIEREHPRVRYDSLVGLPFDTVTARRVVAELASRKLVALTYSYGYESTETVIWSPLLRKFLYVFSCC